MLSESLPSAAPGAKPPARSRKSERVCDNITPANNFRMQAPNFRIWISKMSVASISDAAADIREGRMFIVVGDEDRENGGDLVCGAEKITPEIINFMARHARGLICLPLTEERCEELHLPMQVSENTSTLGTAFTISIEGRRGVTTGISAADRATTILTAVDQRTKPRDLARP